MQTKNIYFTNRTSLAYEQDAFPSAAEHTIITVSSGRKEYLKRREQKKELALNILAAAAVLITAAVIYAFIIRVASLILSGTGSFTAAGCYMTAMQAFVLIFCDNISRIKRSCFAESLTKVWLALSVLSLAAMITYSAFFSPDSGGSMIFTAAAGILAKANLCKGKK